MGNNDKMHKLVAHVLGNGTRPRMAASRKESDHSSNPPHICICIVFSTLRTIWIVDGNARHTIHKMIHAHRDIGARYARVRPPTWRGKKGSPYFTA